MTRWWFQIYFIFIPTWGNDPIWLILCGLRRFIATGRLGVNNLTNIFQMGWNHHLDDIDWYCYISDPGILFPQPLSLESCYMMSQVPEVLGSKVIGSVGLFTPTYPIYRWNDPLIRSALILTNPTGDPIRGASHPQRKNHQIWSLKSAFLGER